ncbi:MAG: hypothetical protein ABSG25_08320, partial [Bryobacteraceae bacterium]
MEKQPQSKVQTRIRRSEAAGPTHRTHSTCINAPEPPGQIRIQNDGLTRGRCPAEIARNSVESQRLSTLIDYATAAPFAIDFLETAFAIEDSNS